MIVGDGVALGHTLALESPTATMRADAVKDAQDF